MTLLLAGRWTYQVYEEACAAALEALGVRVIPFAWASYFQSPIGRIEARYILPGPNTQRLNRDLVAAVRTIRPDVVLVWRGTNVLPATLPQLRVARDTVLACYNNDDPFSFQYRFSSLHHRRIWRYFADAVPAYDMHFAYRTHNVAEFKAAGARSVALLRSYYVPELHRPVELNDEDRNKYACDIVFIGHYTPERHKYLSALISAGFDVKLFGSPETWTRARLGRLADYFGGLHNVYGAEYAKALCGARMCLCAFSRMNRDTYTRRIFEITACGRALLSERTEEMLTLFREDEEAIYFSDTDDLVEKAARALAETVRLDQIAAAGYKRCLGDGHSVSARMKYLLSCLDACREHSPAGRC